MWSNYERLLARMIARASVAALERPMTPEDVDALFYQTVAKPFDEAKVARILAKVKGETPMGSGGVRIGELVNQVSREQAQELVALHRAKTEAVSPEIASKMAKLRKLLQNGLDGSGN